jgi:hypothetical protein
MKSVFALAALAAISFTGAAFAGGATPPKAMSDSELDRVTAGQPEGVGGGIGTAITVGGATPQGEPGLHGQSPVNPGSGRCTTGASGAICN